MSVILVESRDFSGDANLVERINVWVAIDLAKRCCQGAVLGSIKATDESDPGGLKRCVASSGQNKFYCHH